MTKQSHEQPEPTIAASDLADFHNELAGEVAEEERKLDDIRARLPSHEGDEAVIYALGKAAGKKRLLANIAAFLITETEPRDLDPDDPELHGIDK